MTSTEIVKHILEADEDFDPIDYVKSATNRESAVEVYNGPMVRVIQPTAAFTINNYLTIPQVGGEFEFTDEFFKVVTQHGPIYLAVDKADHDNIAIFQPSTGKAWNQQGKEVEWKEIPALISSDKSHSKWEDAKNPQEDKNWLDLQQGLATFFMTQIAKKKNVGQWVKYLTMIGRTDLATNYARYLGRAKLPFGKSIDAVLAMKKAGKRSRNRIARLMKSQENVKWGERGFWLLFDDWSDLAPFFGDGRNQNYKKNAEKIFGGETSDWFDGAETKPEEVWDNISDKSMALIRQLLVNRTVYNSDGEEHLVTRENVDELTDDEIKDIVCDRGNKGDSCEDIYDAIRYAAHDSYASSQESAYYEGYQHALMSAFGVTEGKTMKWIPVGKKEPDKKLEGGMVEKGSQKTMLGFWFPYSTLEEWIDKWKADEYEDDFYGDIHELALAYIEKIMPNDEYFGNDDNDYFNEQLDYHLSEIDLTAPEKNADPNQPELPLEGEPDPQAGELQKNYAVHIGTHPNEKVYKGVNKQEATKYREAMKPQRDDITFRAESFLAQPLNRLDERDVKIEFEASDEAASSLIPFLKELKKMGSQGSSRDIKIEDWDGRDRFGFDGDGASKIGQIKVDGQVVENEVDPKAMLMKPKQWVVRFGPRTQRAGLFLNRMTGGASDIASATRFTADELESLKYTADFFHVQPDDLEVIQLQDDSALGESTHHAVVEKLLEDDNVDPKAFVSKIPVGHVLVAPSGGYYDQKYRGWGSSPDRSKWFQSEDEARAIMALHNLQDHKILPVFDDPFPVKESVFLEAIYKLSTTQIDLPKEIGGHIIQWGELNIADDDLYIDEKDGCGRETEQHVSVLYGLTDPTPPEALTKIVESTKPFLIEFAGVSIFENEKYDVIKIGVVSEELHNLQSQIRKACPNENKFPDYQPHCTIAYVKKGKGKKYAGEDVFKAAKVPRDFWAYDLLFKGAGDSEDANRVVQLIHFDKSKPIEEPDEPEAGDQRYPQATEEEPEAELAVAENLDTKAFLARNIPVDCPECHSTNLSDPDDEGLVDCLECGIWFNPFHPANKPVRESANFHGHTKYSCGHESNCRCKNQGQQHESRSVDECCPLCKGKKLAESEEVDPKKLTKRAAVDPHPDWQVIDRAEDKHGRIKVLHRHKNGRVFFKLINEFFGDDTPKTPLTKWSVYVYGGAKGDDFMDGEDFEAGSYDEAETTATNIAFEITHSTAPSLFQPAPTKRGRRHESEETMNAKEFLARTTQYRVRVGIGAQTRYLWKEDGQQMMWKDFEDATLFTSDEAGELIDAIGDQYGGQPVVAELVDDGHADRHLGEGELDPKDLAMRVPQRYVVRSKERVAGDTERLYLVLGDPESSEYGSATTTLNPARATPFNAEAAQNWCAHLNTRDKHHQFEAVPADLQEGMSGPFEDDGLPGEVSTFLRKVRSKRKPKRQGQPII